MKIASSNSFSFSVKFFFFIFIAFQCVRGFEFLDYTEAHVFNCTNPDNPPPGVLILHEIDRYLYMIICPITLCASSFIIFTFIKYPGIRNSPGDLLLAISLCEFLLNLHWFISSITTVAEGGPPQSNGTFCKANTFFSIPAGFLDFAYNFLLNWYVSFSLKHSLRGYSPNTTYWHIFMVFSAALIITGFEVTDQSGLSIFGTCSYTSNRLLYVSGPLIGFTYMFLGLYTRRQFTKSLSGEQQHRARAKREQFQIYFSYVVITGIIYQLLGVANFLIGLNCIYFLNPGLNIFITITNFLKLLSPFILSLLRFRDPILRNKINQLLKPIKDLHPLKNKLNSENGENSHSFNSDRQGGSYNKFKDLAEYNQHLKQINLRSIINGISKHFSQNKEAILNQFIEEDYLEREETVIENEEMDDQYERLSMRMTAHAPAVFAYLRSKDTSFIDCASSTDVNSNEQAILGASGKGEGGAGNEFFFFSFDNKLLLKTINGSELKILLKKLDKFIAYFEQEPTSFIAKIYGIFTFQQLSTSGTQEHLIVMRNIASIDNQFVERKYDLKGSSYNRHVSANNKHKNLKDLVLKDVDFKEFEQKIQASQAKKSEVSQILEFDSNFLQGCGFMDYSLLILKVDWNAYFQQKQSKKIEPSSSSSQEEEEICPSSNSKPILKNSLNTEEDSERSGSKFINKESSVEDMEVAVKQKFGKQEIMPFQSSDNPNLFYHIGIIDYLQQWTIKKSLERTWKNCVNGRNVDTSSQPPRVYSDRFKGYVRQIFE